MSVKVSVIITCYNRENYVSRAIRSALSQRFPPESFEVIVVDDGSTDHSPLIAADYGDEIVYIRHEENRGLPCSRNTGIRRARGRYVVNLDADDYMHRDLLYVEHLHLALNPHWGAVSCDYVLVDECERHIGRVSGTDTPIACGVMFRKDALIAIGLYDEELLVCEDRDLRLRFMEQYRVGHVDLPLYRYRRHRDNLTNDKAAVEYYDAKVSEKHSNPGGPEK
jgi:glycosyltransferase involved in cell wall biosynthesis